MAFSPWTESHFKSDEPSRRTVKIGRRQEQLAQWTGVCKWVDKRDGGKCRVCGRRCHPKAIGLIERASRHHIEYRSRGGLDETWNVVTICGACDEAQHRQGTLDIRGDADRGIEVWRLGEDRVWFMARREQSVGVWERD